ncbi:bifunctional tRNA pseudouridine(32) synthase/23S rRNA pseudouridine(746) synthase RluA [Motilimonas cestriensis]|uniref:Pseudouridine synthase n=1 Tax=Motilimonas cestriensis TaxID=2742685 RepID=A0ABS8WA39_9GAMM|nr:bifunctional tRNA pseudouridine(32) synthase/23S rRNA pseudouridine(746) synthase RluA [Motilimonas cestriensis]MCE2595125.1 bifunctional tRNA pseudouridine(32) synthase/23S rRNA pseudouridine(746) synthase RluA [Motilimonas cestriensis]
MAMLHYTPPTDPWLDILFQDRDIIVVNKPSGLLSVPGRDPNHSDSTWRRVQEQFPDAQIVHRLDMATSGVMVLAMHKEAERNLKMQFMNRETEKVYYARVWGHLAEKAGEVDFPLICDWPNRPKQIVCYENGKASKTFFEVESEDQHSSLVKLTPITGRTHQLRVHMQAIGHPILGDYFYATPEALAMSERLLLHATWLKIKHPRTHQSMEFSCEHGF